MALGVVTVAQLGVAALVSIAIPESFSSALRIVFLAVGILALVLGTLALLPSRGLVPNYGGNPSGTLFADPGALTRPIPSDVTLALVGVGYGIALVAAAISLPV